MDNDEALAKLEKGRKVFEQVRKEYDTASGSLQANLKRLEADFSLNGEEEAKIKKTELEKEIQQLESERDLNLEKLEKEYELFE